MSAKKYLIVNADDFGQSPGVNRGIIDAHEHGIVTSASLMVRWPTCSEAVAYSRSERSLSVGLHVDLYEWTLRDGAWVALYEVVPTDDVAAVAREVARQLEIFRALMGRNPTHIDSHQHAHLAEPVRSVVVEAARELAVPLRKCNPGIRYCGDFYGQTSMGLPFSEGISVEHLAAILANLRPGFTELGCHPGEGNDLSTMYSSERTAEVDSLCDPRIHAAVSSMGIQLCSFNDFARLTKTID